MMGGYQLHANRHEVLSTYSIRWAIWQRIGIDQTAWQTSQWIMFLGGANWLGSTLTIFTIAIVRCSLKAERGQVDGSP